MEQKFYTDDFEKMLREKADDFKMIPSRRVWHSIYNDLHPSRRWPSVAMSLLLIGALLFTGYLNSGNSKTNNSSKNGGSSNVLTASTKSGIDNNSSANFLSTEQLYSSAPIADVQNNNVSSKNINQNISQKDDLSLSNSTAGNNQSSGTSSVHGQNNSGRSDRGNHNQNLSSSRNRITVGQRNVTVTTASGLSGAYNNDIAAFDKDPSKTVSQIDNGLVIEDLNASDDLKGSVNNSSADINDPLGSDKNNTDATEKNKLSLKIAKKAITDNEQKAWMEDYALHNKPKRNRWKGNTSWELYATPSLTYRKLSSNSKYDATAAVTNGQGPLNAMLDDKLAHKMSLGLELGGSVIYAFAKNFRFKTGLQVNYTDYNIDAYEMNHPVLTTVTMNDVNSGYPYQVSRSTSISSFSGLSQVTLHSRTYQVAAVAGLDVKLYGNEKLKWYAGATIQPTYIVGGKAYLLSTDHRNYIADNSILRSFNLATAFETFVSYKSGTFTWQLGPQFRYQLMSTYDQKYSQQENLFNTGIKFGVVKSF